MLCLAVSSTGLLEVSKERFCQEALEPSRFFVLPPARAKVVRGSLRRELPLRCWVLISLAPRGEGGIVKRLKIHAK